MTQPTPLVNITADLVKTYIVSTSLAPNDMLDLIRKTYDTLNDLSQRGSDEIQIPHAAEQKQSSARSSAKDAPVGEIAEQVSSNGNRDDSTRQEKPSTEKAEDNKPVPAVPIRESVTPDYIICLEDGKKLKMLRRYLMTHYGMTPDDYRRKWGLSKDYPMVCPEYSARRSELARDNGFGAPTEGRSSAKKDTLKLKHDGGRRPQDDLPRRAGRRERERAAA